MQPWNRCWRRPRRSARPGLSLGRPHAAHQCRGSTSRRQCLHPPQDAARVGVGEMACPVRASLHGGCASCGECDRRSEGGTCASDEAAVVHRRQSGRPRRAQHVQRAARKPVGLACCMLHTVHCVRQRTVTPSRRRHSRACTTPTPSSARRALHTGNIRSPRRGQSRRAVAAKRCWRLWPARCAWCCRRAGPGRTRTPERRAMTK